MRQSSHLLRSNSKTFDLPPHGPDNYRYNQRRFILWSGLIIIHCGFSLLPGGQTAHEVTPVGSRAEWEYLQCCKYPPGSTKKKPG